MLGRISKKVSFVNQPNSKPTVTDEWAFTSQTTKASMSISPRVSFFKKSRKSLNIIENDTPAPAKEKENPNLLMIPSKSSANGAHDETKPNKVIKFLRQITGSPTKFKSSHNRHLTAKVSYTKKYEDFAPPETDGNIPTYNKNTTLIGDLKERLRLKRGRKFLQNLKER